MNASSLTPVLGSDVTVTCDASSNEVSIEKDGKLLGNKRSIRLLNVTSEDSGLYVCLEKSSTGTKMASLYLKVICMYQSYYSCYRAVALDNGFGSSCID